MTVSYRHTVQTDIWELAETLRLADVIEVGLAGNPSLYEAIKESVELTPESITAVDGEGNLICIFGYSPSPHAGIPWMLCSHRIAQHKKEALRMGKGLVDYWRRKARSTGLPMLCNWIHKENHSARRFITALGFTIYPSPGKGDFDFFILPCADPQPQCSQ